VNHDALRDDRLRQDVEASYMDVYTRVDELSAIASLYAILFSHQYYLDAHIAAYMKAHVGL
jgi:hypothetical protein